MPYVPMPEGTMGGLVLTRKRGQTIIIINKESGERLEIRSIHPGEARLHITAPENYRIIREELEGKYECKKPV